MSEFETITPSRLVTRLAVNLPAIVLWLAFTPCTAVGQANYAAPYTFTVQPHAPRVSINAPRDGLIFIGDRVLFLDASATDLQDGVLNGTNLQWTSSRDGPLGQGEVVTFDAIKLSVTVTAVDSAGLPNSAFTHLWALHYPPPQLNIQGSSGKTNATLSRPAYYTNYLLQTSASIAAGSSGITNKPTVVGDQQTVSVPISGAASFFRLIRQP